MSENTKIEWCDHTFNGWEGCQKAGPGCDHCYAETRNARFGGGTAINWGPGAPRRRTSVQNWNKPLAWNKNHDAFFAEHGRRQRVFCSSLADVFDNAVDPMWRADLFALIRATPNLDWLLLTKRIGNVNPMLKELRHSTDEDLSLFDMMPLPNVWIGSTIVNQEEADRDIHKLLAVPAAKRFLSMEPLLGPVDLTRLWLRMPSGGESLTNVLQRATEALDDGFELRHPGIDWVIVGGESGPGARPMHPNWARSLRDQCEDAGVPFLFKQWGEWLPGQNEIHPESWDGRRVAHHQDGSWGATETKVTSKNYVAWDSSGCIHRGCLIDKPLNFLIDAWAERVGKKAAGRLLDGITHDGYPS